MILVDMNQVTISNLMMSIGSKRQNDVDENLVRHMVLNSLRMYRSRFSEEYGELVLCYDSKKYWRRETVVGNPDNGMLFHDYTTKENPDARH